jgi:4-amino-4-deoxy-L-arabinose transferase-like glycosyltransferase
VTDKQQMRAALLVILAIGLALRVVGLRYGLPAVYNPDEIAIMARALSFAKGSLNPHNFLYPTFYFYVLFVWVGTYLGYLWLTGRAASIAALQYLYFTDRTSIYTAGRSLGVAAGTATIVVLHWLATRLWDARTGIAAAVFLATAPLHVRDSHYVKHDVPVTLAIVAAYVAFVRIWPCARMEGPNLRDSIMAGAACGVAFSTHYYSIFLTLPLAWTIYHGFRSRGASVIASHLIAAGAASAAMFFALSPFIALEPLIAWRDVVANREIVVDRAVAAGAFAPALRYAEMLLWDSTGLPVLVLGVIGAVRVAIATPARAIQLLAFPLPFLIFIANTAPASRYLNPVLPFVACFAGWSIAWLTARATPAVFWAAVIATAAPGLLASIRVDMFFRQTDTRTLAQSYIESHIASGSTIAIQPYSVQLTPSREGLVEALTRNLGSASAASTKFQLQLSLEPYPAPAYRLIYLGSGGFDAEKIYVAYNELGDAAGLDALRRRGVAFVVIKRYNKSDPETVPLLTTLAREGRRVAVFSPYRLGVSEAEEARIDPFLHNTDTRIDNALERPGPTVEIWEIGQALGSGLVRRLALGSGL